MRKTTEPVLFLSAKLWQFTKNQRNKILLYCVLFIIANLCLLSSPLIFGKIISEIQSRGIQEDNLLFILLLLGLLFLKDLFFWIFHGPARIIERKVAFEASLLYRKYLLEGILDLDISWHNDHDSGNTLEKIRKAVEGLNNFGENVFQIVQTLVRLIGTSMILFIFSPTISLVVFILVICSLLIIFLFDKKMMPQFIGLNEFANKASASFFDALSNVTSVKILHIEKPLAKGVLARFSDSFPLFLSNTKLNEWKWFTGILLFQAITVIPLGAYIIYKTKTHQTIDAGVISTLYLYLSELMFVYFSFGAFYQQLFIFRNGVLNASTLESTIANNKKVERKSISPLTSIAFNNLTFCYKDSSQPGFDQVNIKIFKGQKIAIVGESGSGKTTLLKVIHGMYSSAKALILIDDKLVKQSTRLSDIDFATMLVPQEPEIFSSTIRENLTLGVDYNEDRINNAVGIARFTSVLESLPKGLESLINEKGVNLSGGQKQRLALARAILFSDTKDFLLLDESTSSVDAENELAIYKNIFSSFQDKTIIASIHKMNLLKLFDRILILDKNKIIDDGSFEDLLARNLSFRQAWQQFIDS